MFELLEKLQTLDKTSLALVAVAAERLVSGKDGTDCLNEAKDLAPISGSNAKPQAVRMLRVSEDVKHLSPEQVDELTAAFRRWRDKAGRANVRTSRERVYGLYLLLRNTGAKLGEVLSLDDRTDIDLGGGIVRLAGGPSGLDSELRESREVALGAEVLRELAAVVRHPLLAGLQGRLFRLDQGFVRRKFSERAQEIGLPRDLANPMVLRHTRAVELLREGAPLHVVQRILGHATPMATASYVNYEADDLRRLISFYMNKEPRMQTSARNKFIGKVASVKKGTILSEVVVTTTGGFSIVSVITNESLDKLAVAEGRMVAASVKAPLVILVKDPDSPRTSSRNRLQGEIKRINQGTISAEIVLELHDGTEVCALITDESVKALDLTVGEKVWALFKAFSVILGTEDSES
ncbi:MAG: integrase [Deltaproteobacteria bacterium]|nr:integrase [Deltaproteobacteria bacterium]